MKFLPKEIRWISVFKCSYSSYQEVLVVTHKHNAMDWQIDFGWIEPILNYTDFKIMKKRGGLSSHYPDMEVQKHDIIAIGIIKNYGCLE